MGSFVPVFGGGTGCWGCDSILVATRSLTRLCSALRTLCLPRNICFSRRDRFSIMWSCTRDQIRTKHTPAEKGEYLRPGNKLSYPHHSLQFRRVRVAQDVKPIL